MNAASRNKLVALLVIYILIFVTIAMLFTHHAITIVRARAVPFEIGDLYVFGFSYTLLFNLLTTPIATATTTH